MGVESEMKIHSNANLPQLISNRTGINLLYIHVKPFNFKT